MTGIWASLPTDGAVGARAAAVAIFAATYLALAFGRVPLLRIDRAGIALVGGSLMVAAGALSIAEAARAIDIATLALLLGMMIVVASLRLSGFFRLAAGWAVAQARRPLALLAAVTAASGLLSAVLLNDAICLVMTPLVADIMRRLDRDPVPYLLAVAMAANIGSAATITGNPQNILIGSFSHIPYDVFAAHLAPLAAIGLVLTVAVVAVFHPGEFRRGGVLAARPRPAHVHRKLAVKSVVVVLLMIAAFVAGAAPVKVAAVGGGALLVTRMVPSHRIYREIDWPLLVMFAGLFVVVAGFEKAVLTPQAVAAIGGAATRSDASLGIVTALLSNIVSNVPAVLVLKPFVAAATDTPAHDWLVIAMASTFAGNLTVLGSVANLIVVQLARAQGVRIGFWQYFRVGAPLTVLTVALGLWWL